MPRIPQLPAVTSADGADLQVIEDVSASSTVHITKSDYLKDAATHLTGDSIDYSKINKSTLSFGNYSSSETNTELDWIDGKKIYKKTINFGTLPNANTKLVPHGITGISYVIHIEGSASDGTAALSLPYAHPTSSNSVALYRDGANIGVITGSNRTTYTTVYITLYYVK